MHTSLSVLVRGTLLTLTLASVAEAQLIRLETVPVAAGDQFAIFPSMNLGMGGANIALDDPLLDPFVNPAKGARVDASWFFGSPTFDVISRGNGITRTLPVGAVFAERTWFGGGIAAMQHVEGGGRLPFFPPVDPASTTELPSPSALDERSVMNKYAQVMVGRTFGEGRFALALSGMIADLNTLDGIEDLFADAWDIEESGHVEDVRLGFTAALGGSRRFEAVLVHDRFNMSHDVTSVAWTLTDTLRWRFTPEVVRENNLNQTHTWGLHVGYTQPLSDPSWRIGGILTVNRKLHTKIPTFDPATEGRPSARLVPRDPGDSWAYNIGVGLAKPTGATRFAIDVVFEPAESYTWADETTDVIAVDGRLIPAGGKTVENWFDFANASINVGVDREVGVTAFQLGLRAHNVDYRLRQIDHVAASPRTYSQEWIEWTPSWGVRVTLPGLELRYQGSASSASHFPFILPTDDTLSVHGPGDVLAAPRGDIVIPDLTVVRHRLAISVPMR